MKSLPVKKIGRLKREHFNYHLGTYCWLPSYISKTVSLLQIDYSFKNLYKDIYFFHLRNMYELFLYKKNVYLPFYILNSSRLFDEKGSVTIQECKISHINKVVSRDARRCVFMRFSSGRFSIAKSRKTTKEVECYFSFHI